MESLYQDILSSPNSYDVYQCIDHSIMLVIPKDVPVDHLCLIEQDKEDFQWELLQKELTYQKQTATIAEFLKLGKEEYNTSTRVFGHRTPLGRALMLAEFADFSAVITIYAEKKFSLFQFYLPNGVGIIMCSLENPEPAQPAQPAQIARPAQAIQAG